VGEFPSVVHPVCEPLFVLCSTPVPWLPAMSSFSSGGKGGVQHCFLATVSGVGSSRTALQEVTVWDTGVGFWELLPGSRGLPNFLVFFLSLLPALLLR
jgi:hypothetical protein